MKPLFPRWSDSLLRFAVVVAIGGVGALLTGSMLWVRTPYMTGQAEPIVQPIKFDHRHHVRDDGVDCRYCHAGAERSAYAGIPAVSSCMNCHSQIWELEPGAHAPS